MEKITDFTGIDWALMAAKDSAGRVYIRAYRNAWDAKKKRSYMKSKIHVGRLENLTYWDAASYLLGQRVS